MNLNQNDSELVLNGKIKIKHPLNNDDNIPAAGQHKDFSLCMESNKNGCWHNEEREIVGYKRKFYSDKFTV